MDIGSVTKPLMDALLLGEEDAWKDELEKLKRLTSDERSQVIRYAEDRAAHFRQIPSLAGFGAAWDCVKRLIMDLEAQ